MCYGLPFRGGGGGGGIMSLTLSLIAVTQLIIFANSVEPDRD